MPDIFKERKNIQPYEYPHLLKYADAIWESFWTPEHFTYDRDVIDFKIKLKDHEKEVVKRSMLAIGVVENKVKSFWGRLDQRLPKTEISDVGSVFAGNETTHRRTYEKLLNLLGLEKEFNKVFEVPCMEGRSKYLIKYLEGLKSRSDKEFTKSIILFVMLVENCSLFTYFLLMSSFNKYRNQIMSNFNTVVCATAREENLHGQFGAEIIKIIKSEKPEWFDSDMENKIRRNIRKAFKAESEVLDWIFEEGELDFLTKQEVLEYLKKRFNYSLKQLGYNEEYNIDENLIKKSEYFDMSVKCSISFDFFNEKSVDYAKTNLVTEDDW